MRPESISIAFELFDRVRGAEPSERDRLMADGSGVDSEIREYVRTLLCHDSPTGEFLGRPVRESAAQLASRIAAVRMPEYIGPYRVVRILGCGGFGTVFLAEEPRTRRMVAVKLLRPVFTQTEHRRMEFEAEALGRLTHPAIARVYACGVAENLGGCLYIAMEYIDGLPFDEYVRERHPSIRDRVLMLVTLARALAHAHQNGVLHRDLSPRNILVDSSGCPRVLDFGLACRADRTDAASMLLTAPGAVLGTLRYMSPEHLSGGSRAIDTRSDTFALGVIAYEVITGRHPYVREAGSVGAVIDQILNAPLSRAGGDAGERALGGDLRLVLARSVDRDPQRRYPSAESLADDLERVLDRRPVFARPASIPYLAWRFADRHRAAAASGFVVLVVTVCASAYSGLALKRDMESREAALTALDAVVSSVLTPLAPRIGTLEEREALLRSIQPDIERMTQRMPRDPRILRIRARFLSALADALRERARLDEAYPIQSSATEAYERLWHVGERDAGVGHEYSMAIVKLGDLEKARGARGLAFEVYRRALELDERLVEDHPESVPLLSNLFWSLTRFEERAINDGVGVASAWRERATTIASRMLDLEPKGWRALEAAAFAQSRHAAAASDPHEALNHALAAVEYGARLRDLDPEVKQHQGLFMLHCFSGAEAAIGADRLDVAESLLMAAESAAIRLGEEARDPYVKRVYLTPLGRYHAEVARKRGDLAGEAGWVSQYAAHLEELWAIAAKPDPMEQKQCGDSLLQLCGICARLGDAQELDASKRRLENYASRIATAYPDDADRANWIRYWREEMANLDLSP